jgi:hypothetical protein
MAARKPGLVGKAFESVVWLHKERAKKRPGLPGRFPYYH